MGAKWFLCRNLFLANVKRIWQAIDPTFSMYPNYLADVNKMQDCYFDPLLEIIKENSKKPIEAQQPHISAKTISTRFSGLRWMLKFCVSRQIYIGISMDDHIKINARIEEMEAMLK